MIAVSFLKSNLSRKDTIKKIDESNADLIHVDLMDGLYVENKNFEIDEIIADLKDTTKPLDFHLMVKCPEVYISDLAKLKPYIITFHLNTTSNVEALINLIHEYNIKVGIAINPNEDIYLLNNYLNKIDYVLIMSVYPGKGGQSFIKDVLKKIDYFKKKNILVGIDGGINGDTVKYLKYYHIDNVVSGSFVCMSDDYDEQIKILEEAK